MKFFVPACGTDFVLEEPWTFFLYVERRNKSLFKAFGNYLSDLEWIEVDSYSGWGVDLPKTLEENITVQTQRPYGIWSNFIKAAQITFMPGTKLKVARVYIRNGQKGEFDSITLSLQETTHPLLLLANKSSRSKKSYGRFWVKLIDFNKINGTILNPNVREHNTK